ncbi:MULTISPECIES: hypothetical protein [Capnocytophaga]|nr:MULTISPECIES: hypothetical protein [Capnocytophaga]
MKKCINIIEFDTDKKLYCSNTFISEEGVKKASHAVCLSENNFCIQLSNVPPQYYFPRNFKTIYSVTDGENTMQINSFIGPIWAHKYIKNVPFIPGVFDLKKEYFIKDPITEKLIYYPEIIIKGKDIPVAELMQDYVFGEELFDFYLEEKKRTFDKIKFQMYDISNSLFFSLIPFENTKENIKK